MLNAIMRGAVRGPKKLPRSVLSLSLSSLSLRAEYKCESGRHTRPLFAAGREIFCLWKTAERECRS
jgi:hypothetical protein